MQFVFDDDVAAAGELAAKIFTDEATVERVRSVERAGGFDAELWQTLVDAGLVAIAVPEDDGGAGMGMLGLVAVLEQQGRRVAPVPMWSVVTTALLPLVRFGSAEQRERWLPGLLDGSVLVTGAFETDLGRHCAVRAEPADEGWTLRGEITGVPVAQRAAAFVLPVGLPGGDVAVLLVPADRAGVKVTGESATDQLERGAVLFDGVLAGTADVLDGGDVDVAAWIRRRARVAAAAVAVGVCGEAVAMTAAYTSQRVQFGRALSTNQGVAMRAADAHIDTENIRLTTHRAAWLLDLGREDEAESASLVAKWWASRGGLRVVHATQHLHGGIGADVDYPIHRYFLWGREIAFSLGSAAAVEAELGAMLPAAPPIGAMA